MTFSVAEEKFKQMENGGRLFGEICRVRWDARTPLLRYSGSLACSVFHRETRLPDLGIGE